jgi:protocatechuate 3,4-dioxygenase beta subunit
MNKSFPSESRRRFLHRSFFFGPAIWAATTGPWKAQTKQLPATNIVGGGCDGCEGIYEGLPSQLSWQTSIAAAAEPGERMEISGVVYQLNGKTPAPNVILYAYHTDVTGLYVPAANATGQARRHGRLRGWVKTNAQGIYKFTTIRPAPYPGRDIPAHVHLVVKEPDKNEYYLDEVWFDDDPLVTPEKRAQTAQRGGSGIIHLTKDKHRWWSGQRNIIVGRNIPDYR